MVYNVGDIVLIKYEDDIIFGIVAGIPNTFTDDYFMIFGEDRLYGKRQKSDALIRITEKEFIKKIDSSLLFKTDRMAKLISLAQKKVEAKELGIDE